MHYDSFLVKHLHPQKLQQHRAPPEGQHLTPVLNSQGLFLNPPRVASDQESLGHRFSNAQHLNSCDCCKHT